MSRKTRFSTHKRESGNLLLRGTVCFKTPLELHVAVMISYLTRKPTVTLFKIRGLLCADKMEHFALKKATVEKWQNELADHLFELSESDLNMKRNKTLTTDNSQYITQPAYLVW